MWIFVGKENLYFGIGLKVLYFLNRSVRILWLY